MNAIMEINVERILSVLILLVHIHVFVKVVSRAMVLHAQVTTNIFRGQNLSIKINAPITRVC